MSSGLPIYIEPNLSGKELAAMERLRDCLVPALHHVLYSRSPVEFTRRGGSCCRQVAVLAADFLTDALPMWDWQVWEGDFTNTFRGRMIKYDHAWVYGHGLVAGGGFHRYVDFAHRKDRRVWRTTMRNRYPLDLKPDWTEVERTEVNWRKMLAGPEYYTGVNGKALCGIVNLQTGPLCEKWYEQIRPKEVD